MQQRKPIGWSFKLTLNILYYSINLVDAAPWILNMSELAIQARYNCLILVVLVWETEGIFVYMRMNVLKLNTIRTYDIRGRKEVDGDGAEPLVSLSFWRSPRVFVLSSFASPGEIVQRFGEKGRKISQEGKRDRESVYRRRRFLQDKLLSVSGGLRKKSSEAKELSKLSLCKRWGEGKHERRRRRSTLWNLLYFAARRWNALINPRLCSYYIMQTPKHYNILISNSFTNA